MIRKGINLLIGNVARLTDQLNRLQLPPQQSPLDQSNVIPIDIVSISTNAITYFVFDLRERFRITEEILHLSPSDESENTAISMKITSFEVLQQLLLSM
jgi:hypothetical protein